MTKIRVANAPCSWGVLEFDLEGEAAGYSQVLDEMSQSGYAGTELGDWGFMPTDPDTLRTELEKRSLTLVGAFVPVALADETKHAAGLDSALKTSTLLAALNPEAFLILADDNGKDPVRTKNAGRIQPGQGLSEAQWEIFISGAQRIARAVLDQTGLRTVFHHHCAGYIETPGEINMLMDRSDPELIGLCFDTGHYTYGGGSALEGLRKHADRTWHVHFKDCHPDVADKARREGWDYFGPVRHGVFCELGKGDVDFHAIKAELENHGYHGWIVVEQDVLPGMGSPMESALRNREYLRQLGL